MFVWVGRESYRRSFIYSVFGSFFLISKCHIGWIWGRMRKKYLYLTFSLSNTCITRIINNLNYIFVYCLTNIQVFLYYLQSDFCSLLYIYTKLLIWKFTSLIVKYSLLAQMSVCLSIKLSPTFSERILSKCFWAYLDLWTSEMWIK